MALFKNDSTSNLNFDHITKLLAEMKTTVSQPQTMTIEFDHDVMEFEDLVSKYEVYKIQEDLLVLSCVSDRLRHTDGFKYYTPKLLNKDVFKNITVADRCLATEIRQYYGQKSMIWKLKDVPLTRFREDLIEFIHSDGKSITEKMMGLAYSLPNLYRYDCEIDELFHDNNKSVEQLSLQVPHKKELTHIKTVKYVRKNYKRDEYWFIDEDKNLVNVVLEPNNPLIKLWQKMINKPIVLDGYYFVKSRNEKEYYQCEKYDIVG